MSPKGIIQRRIMKTYRVGRNMAGGKAPQTYAEIRAKAKEFRTELARINKLNPECNKLTRRDIVILLSPRPYSQEIVQKIAEKIPLSELKNVRETWHYNTLYVFPNFENFFQSLMARKLKEYLKTNSKSV